MTLHAFCYDLLNDEHFEKLQKELPKYDLIWSDPPWGNGTLKLFRTTVNKMGSEGTWEELMSRFATLCSLAPMGAFVMMGKRFTPALVDIFAQHGMIKTHQWEGVYSAKLIPLDYVYFDFANNHKNWSDLSNLNANHEVGLHLLLDAKAMKNDLVVFDPFVGLGDACYISKRLGIDLIANEINPARLERAVKKYK